MKKLFYLLAIVLCAWFQGIPVDSEELIEPDFIDQDDNEIIDTQMVKLRKLVQHHEAINSKSEDDDYDETFTSYHTPLPPKINEDCEILSFTVDTATKEHGYITEMWQDVYFQSETEDTKVFGIYIITNTTYILPPPKNDTKKIKQLHCRHEMGNLCVESTTWYLVKTIAHVRREIYFYSVITRKNYTSVDDETYRRAEKIDKKVFAKINKTERMVNESSVFTKDPCHEPQDRRFMECRQSPLDPARNVCQCQEDHRPGVKPGTVWLVYNHELNECTVPHMGICNSQFHDDYWLACEPPSRCSYTTGLDSDFVYCSPPRAISIFAHSGSTINYYYLSKKNYNLLHFIPFVMTVLVLSHSLLPS